MSVFNRMAKRGHYPNKRGIRRIHEDAGIPLPTDPRFLDIKIFSYSISIHIQLTEETQVAIVSSANFPTSLCQGSSSAEGEEESPEVSDTWMGVMVCCFQVYDIKNTSLKNL